ncbi:MAG TPA: chemotaxis protein CheA [Polyangiaceae bacterium]|nr:chemotaxis protein CheA [Polyangiaceae bacterium]
MAGSDQGGRGEGSDRAREEFLSEAQELVDGLGRDVLALDELSKAGRSDPELINDVFRAVHTLKGLSGLFGASLMSGLSHELEEVLDDLRLGRIELSQRVLDVVFRAVEAYASLLVIERTGTGDHAPEVEALLVALAEVSHRGRAGGASPVVQYELDPGLLGVLTEYEEHRLRTNIQSGQLLYKLRVQFPLATIDSALDELKAKARGHGEIITYLPTGGGGDADAIELEILIASKEPVDTLRRALSADNVAIDEVPRRLPQARMTLPPVISTTDRNTSAPPPPENFLPEARTQALGEPPPRLPSMSLLPPDAAREMTLRSVSQTVRVDIRKLDHLMNVVGELAIVRTELMTVVDRLRGRAELRGLMHDLLRLHRSFERHLAQMQGGILEVRMVPLGQAFEKLARAVRQLSREHDKPVNLVITGAETEIDKLIVEELSDPLMHMIRNALDHGIESRDERMRAGKPPVGTIALNAFQKGNQVVLEVEDDGRGIDPKHLAEVAVKRGVLTADEARDLPAREALALIFRPGFTTREEATDLSGRGVGMDVVKTNIAKLGGIVDVSSDFGIGTKVTITLPITLAIISVLFIEVASRTYAIPLASVEEAIVFHPDMTRTFEGREVMTVRGATLAICPLGRLFGHTRNTALPSHGFVVVAHVGARKLGLVVDRLVGQQDIVIKALGRTLRGIRGFAGATELGDQRVALVLDVGALVDEVFASERAAESGRAPS